MSKSRFRRFRRKVDTGTIIKCKSDGQNAIVEEIAYKGSGDDGGAYVRGLKATVGFYSHPTAHAFCTLLWPDGSRYFAKPMSQLFHEFTIVDCDE